MKNKTLTQLSKFDNAFLQWAYREIKKQKEVASASLLLLMFASYYRGKNVKIEEIQNEIVKGEVK